MTARNLQYLFKPAVVALIGASERPGSLGAALTRNLLAGDYQGKLFLVNRRHSQIQGRSAYHRLSDLPSAPDLAIIATPPSPIPDLLTELGRLGARVAIVATSAGPPHSPVGPALSQAMQGAAQPYGLRLIGPDCLGVMLPRQGLNASLSHLQPQPGHLAFVARSGAVVTPVLEWATAQGIGFSSIISLGGMADVDFGDLLNGLAQDADTHAILLYVENLNEVRKFMSAARVATRTKPVLVVRAGRHGDESARQRDAVYDAAFRRAGMLRVHSLRELFWAAQTLALDLAVTGERLAIVGNSGGLGLLARDTLLEEGGQLATLAPATQAQLQAALPLGIAPNNPLDLGDYVAGRQLGAALEILLQDPGVDGVLALHSPNAIVSPEETATAIVETVNRFRQRGDTPKVMVCWLGAASAKAARQQFLDHHIPSYDTPNDAVRAFMQRWRHQQNRTALMETPPNLPELFTADIAAARRVIQTALTVGRSWLTATETALLLGAYGIAPPSDQPIQAPPIAHIPLELLIRLVNDPAFGPALLFGPGGAAAEWLDDFAAALPPLNLVLAREAIAHTRIYRLLRGRDETIAAGLLDAVALLLVKVAQIVVDLDEIVVLELNPIFAVANQVIIRSARIGVVATAETAQWRLAIRPYPRELEEYLPLPDGSTLHIRPVRPEDEPAFHAGFARLSPDEIRMRFMYAMKELSHAEAARLTQIDYDQEMALVVFRQWPDQPEESCGVARISSEPDRERAEFAIVLLPEAVGIGLSNLLLRRLINYAHSQGIRELFGEILRENDAMLKLCRATGFTVKACPDDPSVMIATLRLD
ncbi:MAG: GNAT family N-acetyltransferase [Candidatus Competibacteraceae bacterium]